MNQRYTVVKLLLTIMALTLSACGTDTATLGAVDIIRSAPPSERSLLFVSPADGATGVSLDTVLTLEFEDEGNLPAIMLTESNGVTEVQLELLEDSDGRVTYNMVGLQNSKSYKLYVGATNNTQMRIVEFSTAPFSVVTGKAPTLVENSIDDTLFPLTDLSSYYLVYSEWLDPDSIHEATISLTSASGEHPVRVLLNRENAVITPNIALPNNGPWTLKVSGLYDLSGTPAADFSRQFMVTPLGALSRINIASYSGTGRQSLAQSSSALIGDADITFESEAGVYLGDPITFDGYQPVLIKRGTEFTGNPIQVELGGEIATPLNTGDLRFIVLNDSVGYIQKNPLTDSFDSPQSTSLVIDLAVSTTDAKANAVLTQFVLNGRANGLSRIVDGQLRFSLISTTELDIFESGSVSANLDLILNTVDRQTADFTDSQAPSFRASIPKSGDTTVKPDTSLTMIFDEPLAQESLTGRVVVNSVAGQNVPVTWRVNGSRVEIKPQYELDSLTNYVVTIGAGISDLAGNKTSSAFSSTFRTHENSRSFAIAPRIEGVVPGVACQFVGADLPANVAGHCKVPEGGNRSQAYSVFKLPSNQPVELWLNSLIEPASAYAASSCSEVAPVSVQRVNWSNGQARCVSTVAGKIILDGNNMRFKPDRNLIEGASYQFVIHAGTDGQCDTAELCGLNGKPVDVDPFDGEFTIGGGPDIKIPFIAMKSKKTDTYQPLVSEVRTDINANREIDLEEKLSSGSSISLRMDLCDSTECTNPYFFRTPICAYPGAQPTDPAYSCNPDMPRTEAFLKARFAGNSISYSDAILPVTIGTPEPDPVNGGQRIPVIVPPAIQYATGTTLVIEALIDIPAPTGVLTFRFLQDGLPGASDSSLGYIRTDPNTGSESLFTIDQAVLVDAPELEIPTGGNHNLKNRRISVTLSSLISYTREGKFKLELRNDTPIKLPVTISDTLFGVADGDIVFEVPEGEFKLDVISR